jgi:beta-glucosidase
MATGARGAMPSHNTVLGVPAHGSPWLLNGVLRREFNMTHGLVLSDTGDVGALSRYRLCGDDASCGALALTAGVDVEQPPGALFLQLGEAVARGLAQQADIDAAVARVLWHKLSARLVDEPYVNASAADEVVNSPAHRALAQEAAEEGCVLLVNDGVLPLAPSPALQVALVGPLADDAVALLGNYAGTGPWPRKELNPWCRLSTHGRLRPQSP